MSSKLIHLQVKNFRSLADVKIDVGDVNVLFGPNGVGKSTLLDTIYFVRDCARRGVVEASTQRSHGIGARWDGADEGASISIKLGTEGAEYEVVFAYSGGRIEPFVGELLYSRARDRVLVDRKPGSDQAGFYTLGVEQLGRFPLREPEKLALSRYLDIDQATPPEAIEMHELLTYVNFYYSREAYLYRLKTRGSETSYQKFVWERGENLWSVLRNLHDRRGIDERYDTILDYMRQAFPLFQYLVFEQTGPSSVYASFVEKGRRQPIMASGVSDGYLQMLLHLTALFSVGRELYTLILFDEPEISLHPYAISVFAEAVKKAVLECSKQVFVATHSPVLVSQFEPQDILALEVGEQGQTIVTRVSEKEEIQELLEEYAVGSLYMAELVAPQSTVAVKAN